MIGESQAIALLEASLVRPVILAFAAGILLSALKIRHPASRHAVWTAVLIAMLLLPFLSVSAPRLLLPILPRQHVPPLPAIASTPLPTALPAPAAPPAPSADPLSAFPMPSAATLLLWCYLAGFLAIATYRAVGCVLLRRVLSRATPLRSRPPLCQSSDVVTPVAVGVLRPAILLPVAWRTWSAATRRAVLAHEFAHLRRRDMLVSALARLAQCLFWFHPLAWWLSRKLSELAESACDAAALERLPDPAAYSRILLQFAHAVHRAGFRAGLPGLAMAAPHSDLSGRIDQVFELSNTALRQLPRPTIFLALTGLPALCLAATVAFDRSPAPLQTKPTPSAQPIAFEVASVKTAVPPGDPQPLFCAVPCDFAERLSVAGSRVDIRHMSLDRLIQIAWRIKPYQLSGPQWMSAQKFDIAAKMPDGAPPNRLPEMLQSLLAGRFQLALHRDMQDQPVYALTVARDGPKLRESTADPEIPKGPGSSPVYTPQGEGRASEDGGFVVIDSAYGPIRNSGPGRGPNGGMRIEFLKLTMPVLADLLTPHVDRPVVDRTGLQASYYLSIETRPPSEGPARKKSGPPDGSDTPNSASRPDPYRDALFTAIQKAGLKLDKAQAPVEKIVVDRLEKSPTAN